MLSAYSRASSSDMFNYFQFFTGFFQTIFYLPALGNIFDGQENNPFFTQHSLNLPGIQQHYAPANGGKIVFNLIVIKGCFLGKDGFQQFPQLGDIPLFITQVINKLSHGLFRFYLEEFIEGTADRNHPEVLIQ